jgi:hypothetical protein
MKHQTPIYNQNGNLIRNYIDKVYNTSSDICVFTQPMIIFNGADKIECQTSSCNISGISFNNLFTATTECFIINELSGTCFQNIVWETRIYEDDDLVNRNEFFISNSLSGDTPTYSDFSGSVKTNLENLTYTYEFSGSTLLLNQVRNAKIVTIEILTVLNYQLDCPLTGTSSGNTFSGICASQSEIICNLTFSGLTKESNNVYVVNDNENIEIPLTVVGNLNELIYVDPNISYNIYKYDETNMRFLTNEIYIGDTKKWSEISGTSGFNSTILVNNLQVDGNYLIKPNTSGLLCTEFGALLGKRFTTKNTIQTDFFGIYNPDTDFYFAAFNPAEKPILDSTPIEDTNFGALNSTSFVIDGTTNVFNIESAIGDHVISLNGLTLAPELDYVLSSITLNNSFVTSLELLGPVISGDILTIIFTRAEDRNNIKLENIDINTPIVSGTTNNQSVNRVYYNVTANKYELFTEFTPINNEGIIVTINGIVIANGVDYYQSSSNPKRIILEGILFIGDIVNIYYNADTNIHGNIFTNFLTFTWSIPNAPTNNNGKFLLQISDIIDFSNLLLEVIVNYNENSNTYNTTISVPGGYGDKYYYRVVNEKRFLDVCGHPIIDIQNSDIYNFVVQTNTTNNY